MVVIRRAVDTKISLGSGNDVAIGSAKDKKGIWVKAGKGNDVVVGSAGPDRLLGEGGHDFLDG